MDFGVIIRDNSYTVTNSHGVEGTDELHVMLLNGSEYDAEMIRTDPAGDLVVIRIDVRDLPFISCGDTESIRVGQWVMAF